MSDSRQLFIGNLPFSVGWQDLKDMFREVGDIVRADVAINPQGRSRGFGTVLYSNPDDAQVAIDKFNGYEWDNRIIEVRFDQKVEQSRNYDGNASHKSLYVGNLPYSVGWQDLKDLFREAGDVVRAEIPTDSNGRSKGFGIITMATSEDAKNAIAAFNGHDFNGRKIDVRPDNNAGGSRSYSSSAQTVESSAKEKGCHLFVGNLPFSVQWQELKDLFKQVGNVTHTDVAMDHQGRSRGFGQVTMASVEDAQQAIEQLNGTDFSGRTIEVRLDKFAGEKGSADAGCQVFVGNLPFSTRWQELKDLFRNYNMNPTHADIILDQAGRSKGCGLVVLADAQEAQRAVVEVNGVNFEGRSIIVRMDKFNN